MSNHAACSPSSSDMWLNCAASVTLTKDVMRPSSKYAREGSAAHVVAEKTIKGDPFLPDRVTVEGEEFVVSPGMCRNVNPYVSHVQALINRPKTRYCIERTVMIPSTFKMVWGTLDCGVVHAGYFDHEIEVVDLKYGRGVAVDPDHSQFKLYALGLAGFFKLRNAGIKVTLTVSQPRIGKDPIRSHTTRLGDLQEWRHDIVRPALLKIAGGDVSERAGHWCRWCVRQTECKAFAGRHQKHAAAAFDDNP